MRLGGPINTPNSGPQCWIESLQAAGYRAAYAPVGIEADEASVRAYAKAARDADIVIAEVGVWNNPLAAEAGERNAAIEKCKACLDLAERIGARCCVNIAGSRGAKWDGPSELDLTEETFERIVVSVREIIDAVRPRRTFYTLEPMPWMYPDSPDNYLRLIQAIDRPAFAVHLDPVNMIASPQRYFANAAFLRECFQKLGRYIKSCHAKDILLRDHLTTHLDEVRPGLGRLDYRTFLHAAGKLDPDLPIMLEHLPAAEDYTQAAAYVRQVAAQESLAI
ncbi:MAG: sugar phosphate isomerase/epimerase family protein [Chloroflexota bacterium]